MRRAASILLAALLASAAPALAKKKPAPKPAPPAEGVRVERVDGGSRLDIVLPGRVKGYAAPRGKDGRRDLVLLVGAARPSSRPAASAGDSAESAPCDGSDPFEAARTAPSRLLRLDPTKDREVETVRDDLPAASGGLDAFDVDGDGAEELLLFAPGEIRVFRDTADKRFGRGPDLLVSDPSLGAGGGPPRLVRAPGRATERFLPIATTDGLRTYGRLPGGSFGLLSVSPLPVFASLHSETLSIETPSVTEIETGAEGAAVLAASADRLDPIHPLERLKSLLVDPAAPAERRAVECWSKLPSRERVVERLYRSLDGRAALIATSTSGEKIEILGDKRLRLFLLEEDRTKAGKPAVLAVEIGAHAWQMIEPAFLDADGDGRTDLVVAYWKGLLNPDTVVLEAFLRREDGTFDPSSRPTTIDVKDGIPAFLSYGRDVDGDGAPDLLLAAGGKALVFPGVRPAPRGKGIVADKPSVAIPLPDFAADASEITVSIGGGGAAVSQGDAGLPGPGVIDFEGKGSAAILVGLQLEDGRSAILIFRPSPPRRPGAGGE